jgi:threonine synthase
MANVATPAGLTLDDAARAAVAGALRSSRCADADTLATIALFYKRHGYLLDPHTAVAVRAVWTLDAGNAEARQGVSTTILFFFFFLLSIFFSQAILKNLTIPQSVVGSLGKVLVRGGPCVAVVAVATASPAKFRPDVEAALGGVAAGGDAAALRALVHPRIEQVEGSADASVRLDQASGDAECVADIASGLRTLHSAVKLRLQSSN